MDRVLLTLATKSAHCFVRCIAGLGYTTLDRHLLPSRENRSHSGNGNAASLIAVAIRCASGKKGTSISHDGQEADHFRIDAKIGKDRLKPDQVRYAAAVERAGGIAFAAWSVDDVADRLRMEGLLDG